MHPFRRLNVWRKAHELTIRVYAATEAVSRKHPSLTSQIRRAAYSIPANIAEGAGQASALQFGRFLQIATASARELDYFLLLAADIGSLSRSDHAILEARTDEVARMLVSLYKTVMQRAKVERPSKAKTKSNTEMNGDGTSGKLQPDVSRR